MKVTSEHIFPLNPGSDYYFNSDFNFRVARDMAFRHQMTHGPIFRQFMLNFRAIDEKLESGAVLPFLPIETFKKYAIQTGTWVPEKIFRSSGTTANVRSSHLVRSVKDYQRHTIHLFENHFGTLNDFQIFALLPNYLEAGDSSLVNMVQGFLQSTGQKEQAFFLYNFTDLQASLAEAVRRNRRILLFGVTFALQDFAQHHPIGLPSDTIIIETGGMKGRGIELMRSDLHQYLSTRFEVPFIYSEYGMTELMSQAYSNHQGRFKEPPSMQISIREINDPLTEVAPGKSGVVHIIDLANIHTCSFIATADLGVKHLDGTFEIIGRVDQSDARGCHLLYVDW